MTGPTETPPEPTTPSSTELRQNRRIVATALTISGIATIVVAIVLGAIVEPYLYAIAVIGLVDLVLARLFAAGRLGGRADDPAAAAAAAEADPSYNPYARED